MNPHDMMSDIRRDLEAALTETFAKVGKKVHLVDFIIRPGELADATWVGVVHWADENAPISRMYATHKLKVNWAGSWDFYWGHYDLGADDSLQDFRRRCGDVC